ncbi:MAG TPA: glycosyltransferase [Anaerolineales bacterium]|nr:glycosyltransferase [Anaerolineales bacterium]
MHITILALGSRGDVQPFVPLGKALQDARHRVCVATFELFASMIRDAGLEFYPIHGDIQAILSHAMQEENASRKNNPFQTMLTVARSFGSLTESLPQDLTGLLNTDLILNQLPANLFGGDLAEYLGIPWAIVTVIPLTRTRTRPLVGFPNTLSWLPGYNLFTYWFGEQVGWQLFRKTVNRVRTGTFGLSPQPFFGPYKANAHNRVPVLCGFSEHVVPRPPDWDAHVHLTGWWFPDEPAWTPPPELVQFLDAGSPPVFIGFGSMPVSDPAQTTAHIVEAVRLSGQRAILHAGWAGLGGALPPEIFPITYAPYGWLFPKMAAIVHHGGSGTTGLGFWSGVPSLIVPFVFDQFYWGARTAEMGVGPKPIPFNKLTPERLAASIQTAVTDSEMRRRATDLGQKLRAENGIQRAVEIIQTFKQ